jgi:hypothetical protein
MSQWDSNEVQRQLEARRADVENLQLQLKQLKGQITKSTPTNITPTKVITSVISLPYLTAHGIVIGQGDFPPITVVPDTIGKVLTDNGPGLDPSYKVIPPTTGISKTVIGTFIIDGVAKTSLVFTNGLLTSYS